MVCEHRTLFEARLAVERCVSVFDSGGSKFRTAHLDSLFVCEVILNLQLWLLTQTFQGPFCIIFIIAPQNPILALTHTLQVAQTFFFGPHGQCKDRAS